MARTPSDTVTDLPVTADIESALAAVLAEVVPVDRGAPDDNFFDQLGADSMVLARFCAKARKRPDLPSPSMRDVYDHPTIASLAAALTAPAEPAPETKVAPVPEPGTSPAPGRRRAGTAAYVFCGVLQF